MTQPISRFRLTWKTSGQLQTYENQKLRVVIGRAPDCDVTVREDRISRHHANIFFEDGRWYIADMNSANGTFVNSRHITRHELRPGDTILLGATELKFFPLSTQTGPEHRVVFREEPKRKNYTAAINMAELKSLMNTGLVKAEEASQSHSISTSSAAGTWVIALFSQAASTLVACRESREMMEKVLELLFKNMPCERGFIGLIDENEEITSQVTRSKSNDNPETISISRSIAQEAIKSKQAMLIDDTHQDARFSQEDSILAMNIRSAMCAPLYNEGEVIGLIYVDSMRQMKKFTEQHLQVLSTLAMLLAMALEQTRMREKLAAEQEIRGNLQRYMAPAVVERIVSTSNGSSPMHAEPREVTVIFADICGFTTMSEKMEPTQVAMVLNRIFEWLTEAIFEYEGTLDKYIGDAIMAFFGAPFDQPDHAVRAVRASLLMQQKLIEVNEELGMPSTVKMRIGINSGKVAAACIGSPRRLEYTVIGDVVNTASRIESQVAEPGTVVIGPRTYELVRDQIRCEALPPKPLKGKEMAVQCYRVLPLDIGATTQTK